MQITPTITQFCHSTWHLEAQIQLIHQGEGVTYVVTQSTPFHPVSHIWPDHPADRGTLNGVRVIDCLVGAVELSSGELYIDKQIPVKRDEPGWAFVVVHCLDATDALELGQTVQLCVDKEYQQALSRGHSAGHIAYLALNKVLTEQNFWRKDADRKDPLGHYDFNSYAQVTSFVTEDKCVDTYRLGKTLRKRGLNSAEMLENLEGLQESVNAVIATWLTKKSDITVFCAGETLTDSRYWRCDLGEDNSVEIPCGGTHAGSLEEYADISVTLIQIDAQNIEMHTNVRPA